MIDEVSISNYKSIVNQRILTGNINLFVGSEASGKTNILEALGFAAAAHDNSLTADALMNRGIRAVPPSLTFHSYPQQQDQKKEVEIQWYEKKSWKKTKLICNDTDDIDPCWKDVSWIEPEYIIKINSLIDYISDGTIEGEYPFQDEKKNETLKSAFRASRNFRNYLIYNVNSDALLGETNENLIALLMSDKTPSIFAVDNIEAIFSQQLYSGLLHTISQLAVLKHKQAFITTSNLEIVEGLDITVPEHKLFLVKMVEGQTIIEEIKDKSLINI